ncbi:Uncharacterised protein [Mycobacterium tuberculosis]|nr:Uncharacterised protein [Mycobacterium tuberculosis]CKT48808.1 Uncharacterised protein [Mycobacterium tuberculosis]COW41526.1 Uncharacterised protein [Mycobacterium tuberculosis]COZ69250.1 Uncharacterised protein [Mycobacterium tuberculosis]
MTAVCTTGEVESARATVSHRVQIEVLPAETGVA